MGDNGPIDRLADFYEEYAAFLAQVLHDEEEKLQALLSNSLQRIERAISSAQANAKQMENMEQRRERLQERAGFAGMTFSQLVEQAPEQDKPIFRALLERIQSYVEQIKYHNEKAMEVARANVRLVNPNAILPEELGQVQENPYARARRKAEQTSILETKI